MLAYMLDRLVSLNVFRPSRISGTGLLSLFSGFDIVTCWHSWCLP